MTFGTASTVARSASGTWNIVSDEKPKVRREQHAGEGRDADVLRLDGVVIVLPGEADLVLGRRQLFHQPGDVLLRAEIGIGFDQREQAAQRAAQRVLGLHRLLGGVGGDRLIARRDDGRELALLDLHGVLDRIDEIGNEVVAALQLDIDLRPGIAHFLPAGNEAVIDADDDEHRDDDDTQNDP